MEKEKSLKEVFDEEMRKFMDFVEGMKKSMGLPMFPDMKTGVAQYLDQREIRLKYIISIEKCREFFNKLIDGKVMATRCNKCGEIYFPPQYSCPGCRVDDLGWIELSREGVLLTYTQINIKPYSFSHYDDYIVGICRLPEGVNITAWIRERDPRSLRIGMRMRLEVTKRMPEGYYTYEWVPIK